MGAETRKEEEMSTLPFKLFLLGFLIVFIGVIVLVVATVLQGGEADVSSVVLIFVGPIPIILGAGAYAPFLVILAVILTTIGFVVFFWMRKQAAKTKS